MSTLTLRQLRLAKEITQERMAKSLDIHVNTYIRWESKPSEISINMCYRICEIIGVDYDPHIFLP